MKELLKWESLPTDRGELLRLKVPGGWLVKEYCAFMPSQSSVNQPKPSTAMAFIPDARHEWLNLPATQLGEENPTHVRTYPVDYEEYI